jgi:hypothetical protein
LSWDQIVEFSRQAKLESMHLSILTPLPGTPLFEEMRPHLIFTDFPQDWDYYDGGHCVYANGRLGVQRLQETVLSAHRQFYRGYGWSLRRIRDVLGERAPLMDRLRWLWSTARVAQRTLKEWEEETRMFLELVRAKRAASPPAPQTALPAIPNEDGCSGRGGKCDELESQCLKPDFGKVAHSCPSGGRQGG